MRRKFVIGMAVSLVLLVAGTCFAGSKDTVNVMYPSDIYSTSPSGPRGAMTAR
jgi:hypothetical protein